MGIFLFVSFCFSKSLSISANSSSMPPSMSATGLLICDSSTFYLGFGVAVENLDFMTSFFEGLEAFD
jgi:hypothetical protein